MLTSRPSTIPSHTFLPPEGNAAALGFLGTHYISKGIEFVSEKIDNNYIKGFDRKANMLAGLAAVAISLAPAFSLLDESYAKTISDLLTNHPVYLSGLAGAYVAGTCEAAKKILSY